MVSSWSSSATSTLRGVCVCVCACVCVRVGILHIRDGLTPSSPTPRDRHSDQLYLVKEFDKSSDKPFRHRSGSRAKKAAVEASHRQQLLSHAHSKIFTCLFGIGYCVRSDWWCHGQHNWNNKSS